MNRFVIAITILSSCTSARLFAQTVIPLFECVERAEPVSGTTFLAQSYTPGTSGAISVVQAIPVGSTVTVNPGAANQETLTLFLSTTTFAGNGPYDIGAAWAFAHAAGEKVTYTAPAFGIAHFGYFNPTATTATVVAGGSTNFFSPGNPNRGQPSTFEPGVHRRVFTVPFDTSRDLIWILGSQLNLARNQPAFYCDAPVPEVRAEKITVAPGTSNPGMRLGTATNAGSPMTSVVVTEVWRSQTNTATVPTGDVSFSNVQIQNGIITGDVTVTGGLQFRNYYYTLLASTADGSQNFGSGQVEVLVPCPMTVTPSSLPTAIAGAPYSATFSASGGPAPISYAVQGALPAGVSLSGASLNGTPQNTGSFPFVLRASGVDGCFQNTAYTLQVVGATCGSNVTSQVQITLGGLRQNLVNRHWLQTVTLRNGGTSPIAGPIALALDSLSANASLSNASGLTSCSQPLGSAYLQVDAGSDGVLSPGEAITGNLDFVNSNAAVAITYTPRVVAGGSSR